MNSAERYKIIYDIILEKGDARIGDLAKHLEVSQPTIRKDLLALEQDGFITRKFGRAILKEFSLQSQKSSDSLITTPQKTAIGKFAASLVEDGETILLDCGATTTEMAKSLLLKNKLRVVTTGVNIALILGEKRNNYVILSGGVFQPETVSMSGTNSIHFFRNIHVKKLFLAANGICPGIGLTYADFIDIEVKKAMIGAASEVYLLVSSDKVGHKDFAAIDVIGNIDTIITDNQLTTEGRRTLQACKVKIIEIEIEN